MRNRQAWRGGFGLSQIMAMLLLVLPTMAFIVTLILDYWNVMQIDYRLKLIANMGSQFYNSENDLTVANLNNNPAFFTQADTLCPAGTDLNITASANDATVAGVVDLRVEYDYNGTYFKNRTLSTNIITYSYNDQNLTAVLTCQ